VSRSFSRNRIQSAFVLFSFAFVLTACGGGSSGPSGPGTGTVALLLTDMPTDELAEINLDVTGAVLIGDQGQQMVYTGNTRVNLLDLENYNLPIAFGDAEAGTYTKLRLQIDNLELVDLDHVIHHPALPANGRIDLLQPGGFDVVAGRTLIAELDMDAHRSIHVVQTGNSKYQVRPVVRVNFMLGGLPDKLARIEGRIEGPPDATTGSFLLCSLDNPDTCLDISLATDACVFDADGVPTQEPLNDGDVVVVIGRYSDDDLSIEAIIVELGNASQLRGTVNSLPDAGGTFLMIDRDGNELTVELQDACTRLFGPQGEVLAADALAIGQGIEVEGVVIPPAVAGDPALLRAALIHINGNDAFEQISGTIAEPVAEPGFNLATANGDICVVLDDGAPITLVTGGSEMSPGSFADLVAGQPADAWGELAMDGCFHANSLRVDTGG